MAAGTFEWRSRQITVDREIYCAFDVFRGVFEVARGQRSKVSVGIQDVMRPILLTGCEGAIICHAHPSNNSSNPSKADRQLTKDIQDAIKPFEGECTLIDHVVLTTDTWYSILGNESSASTRKN